MIMFWFISEVENVSFLIISVGEDGWLCHSTYQEGAPKGEGLGHHQEVRGGEQEGGAPDTEAAGARQREADNRRQVQVSRFKGNSSPNLNGFCIEISQ